MLFPALRAGPMAAGGGAPAPVVTPWIEVGRQAMFDFSNGALRTLSGDNYVALESEERNNINFRGYDSQPAYPQLFTQGNRSGAYFDGMSTGLFGDGINPLPDGQDAFNALFAGSKRTARTIYILFRGEGANPPTRQVLLSYNSWGTLAGSLQFGVSAGGRPYVGTRDSTGAETLLTAGGSSFVKSADNLFGYTINADGTVAFSLNGTMLTPPTGAVHNENMDNNDSWNVNLGRIAWQNGHSLHWQGGLYAVLFYAEAHTSAQHLTQWNAAQSFLGTTGGGTPSPSETIALNPSNPGAYTVSVSGEAVPWTTNILTTGLTQFQHAVFTASNSARSAWITQNTTGNSTAITVNFLANGDYLIVRKVDDDSLRAYSGAISISVQSGGEGMTAAPAGWVVDVTDHFEGTSLDTSKWQHSGFGGSAHNGAAEWDGGAGISVHDSVAELQVYQNNGWKVTGWLQGVSTTPGAYAYHPGYGQFHIRVRARWSHALAPGIGAYLLMWPAQEAAPHSEFDILEMPSAATGGQKTRAEATMHWKHGTAQHGFSGVYRDGVDLTQYHIWDFRRTLFQVDGQTRAQLRCWIDGVEMSDNGNRPAQWDNNPDMIERVVFGPATYVGSETGWYGVPDSNTPSSASFFIDYVTIWVPPEGGTPTQRSITLNPTTPGTLQEQVAGEGAQWTFTVESTGITNLSWVVVESGTWAWRGTPVVVPTTGSVQITATLLNSGEFVKVMDADDITFQVDSGAATVVPAEGGTPGGGTPGANPAPAVHLLARGQSNMLMMGESGWMDGAWWPMVALVKALTGIPEVNGHLDRWEDDGAYTVASGTGLYTFNSSPGWDPWIEARGNNQADPSTWPLVFHGLGVRQYVLNNIATDTRTNTPVLLVEGHTEYPQNMSDAESAMWHAAHTNFLDRYRSWTGRSVAHSPIFLVQIPYVYGNWTAVNRIRESAAVQLSTAGRNVHRGAGWTGDTSGDGSHWDGPGNHVAARRMAFALARWLHDNGFAHNDLEWLPKLGPSINGVARTANGNRLRVSVAHDKGNNLVIPSGVRLDEFMVKDTTGEMSANAIAAVDASHFDVTFPRNITGSNAQVWFSFGAWVSHYGLDTAITDNWHTGSVSKPTGAWTGNTMFNSVRFALNSTLRDMNITG